ncbi:MAG: hypothetical protein IKM43_02115 [Clostridia bacterium]|nr:hypothetical protein [Clostridia bacterium]
MRPLDIIRQKRRFEMFNAKSKDKVLELNEFFGKYNMEYEETIKKTFTYYDTPNHDLEKSNIVLYKTQIGKFCELNMATEKINSSFKYNVRTNYKHFTKQIKPMDKILRHKEFLIDNFKAMFMSSINFDPEFLMRKLQVAYVIETTSKEYRSINMTGLKITYSFDTDVYTNHYLNQKVNANILTIYQHSSTKTDENFEDLISKLTRYCKELTPTNETKIMIARKLSQKQYDQIQKAKADKAKIQFEKSKQKKKK